MTTLADRFKEPVFLVSLAILTVTALIINLVFNQNWIVSVLGGILLAGAFYMLYSDYTEKAKLTDASEAKKRELQRRKMEQAQVEAQEGKCISCLAEVPEGATECPNCGFRVQHYEVDKTKAEA